MNSLTPKIVLAVAAHPDDIDFGASGTIAHFAQQGAKIYYLILTNGANGTADSTVTDEELTKTRRQEQRDALKILGGTKAIFLDYPDSALEVTQDVKRDIVKVIRQFKPDVVITMDPSMLYDAMRGYINHPDHRAAGQATMDAVFPLARDCKTFPELCDEGFEPHNTPTLLLINFTSANFAINITKNFDTKLRALSAHKSQISDFNTVEHMLRDLAESAGEPYNYPLAEAFVRIDIS